MTRTPLADAFEDLWPQSVADPIMPPETASAADVDAAFSAGLKEGRRQAAAEAEDEARALLLEMMATVSAADSAYAGRLDRLHSLYKERFTAFCRQFAARSFSADLEKRLGGGVKRLLAAPGDLAPLTIAISPSDSARTERALAPHEELRRRIVTDPDLTPGEFRIAWRDGGIEETRDALAADVDAALNELMSPETGKGALHDEA